MYTTKPALCASAGNPGLRTHSCTTYARDAVFDGFHPRDARAIDYDGFEDRQPHERPHRLDDVARLHANQRDRNHRRHERRRRHASAFTGCA